MVLNIKQAVRVAMLSLLPSVVAQAQRNPGATEIRIGERPVLFGFALACVGCTFGGGPRGRAGGSGRASGPPVLYRDYPLVEAVIPGGAADSAGIREGDILKAIDGLSLLSAEGTRRMSTAVAGEVVRLSFERSSRPFDVSLKLGPSGGGTGDKQMIVTGHTVLRSSPASGAGFEFDLWSDNPVRLAIDSTTSTITFKIGEAVLRVRIPPSTYRDTTGTARGRGKPEP